MNRPVVEIIHREEYAACHRLHSEELSDEENRRVFGICNNPNGHGHNYELEVAVSGPVDARTGMVMNLLDLMGLVRELIIDVVDHKNLNLDVPFLAGIVPTAENQSVAFWEILEPEIRRYEGCRLKRIRLLESRDNLVEYRGGRESSP